MARWQPPWQKIRYTLPDDPRLIKIASLIAGNLASYAFNPASADLFKAQPVLSQRAIRDLAQTALQRVWQRVAQHGCNGQIVASDLSILDQYAEIPGFGQAMASVGWADHCSETQLLTLPDFSKYNLQKPGRNATETAKSSTERSRDRRERLKAERELARVIATATATNGNGNAPATQRTEVEVDTIQQQPPHAHLREGGREGDLSLPQGEPLTLAQAQKLAESIPNCSAEIAQKWHNDRSLLNWTLHKHGRPILITRALAGNDLASFTDAWHRALAKSQKRPRTPAPQSPVLPSQLDPHSTF